MPLQMTNILPYKTKTSLGKYESNERNRKNAKNQSEESIEQTCFSENNSLLSVRWSARARLRP